MLRIHVPRTLFRLAASVATALLLITPGVACRRAAPVNTPLNPPELLQPPPADRSLIATDETLYPSLRADPKTLNAILAQTGSDRRVEELLYDRPFRIDAKLQWMTNDDMVESFVWSADRQSAVLRLRPGLKWHDGQPFTAHDIVFSWQQIMDPRVPVRDRSGKDRIESCTAPDDLTVRYVFKEAVPTNKWNVVFGIIPRHVYEPGKEEDPTLTDSEHHNRFNRLPVGNGPYRIKEWKSGDRIVLERWDDYHGNPPYFHKIVFRIIGDHSARMAAFKRGEIDDIFLNAQQFVSETDTAGFAKVGVKASAPQWKYNYIALNQDGSNPFFVDRRVRRAISFAIDYDRINRQIFHGVHSQSHGAFAPDSPMYNTDIIPYTFDLDRASRLLDEAGWLRDSKDGWRYKGIATEGSTDRIKFSFTLNLPKESATGPPLGAILQELFEKLGIEMKTHVTDFATFIELSAKHEFEASYGAWSSGIDPDKAWNVWHSESYADGRNYVGYSNPRVDELFVLGRRTFDHQQRMGHYAEMTKLIYDDAPYVFLVDTATLRGFNKRIRGVSFGPRGHYSFHPGVLNWWTPKQNAKPAGDS